MPRCFIGGGNNIRNHSFPKDLQLRKLWAKAPKICNFTASKNSRICPQHFKETNFQGICDATGLPQAHRYLKKSAVPSVFSWTKASAPTAAARKKQFKKCSYKEEPSTSQPVSVGATRDIREKVDHRVYVFCSEHIPEDPGYELKMEDTTDDLISPTSQKTVSTQTPSLFRTFSSGDNMLPDAKSVICQAKFVNMKKFYLCHIE